MARSTRSAFSSNSVPGIGLKLASARTQCSRFTRPSRPEKCVVSTENSRSAPSSWLDEVRSFSGQFGQVRSLSSFSRRLRHDLELRHRDRALAEGRADAVGAGVAAADHHDVFAVGEDRLAAVLLLAGDAAVLLRQVIHGEMDAAQVAAFDRQVAALLGAAGQHDRVVLVERAHFAGTVTPTWTLQWKVTPSASICFTRRSMMCFSILKSGMP